MKRLLFNPFLSTPLLIVLFIALWALSIEIFDTNPLVIPSPATVGTTFVELMMTPSTYVDFAITLTEVLVGFVIAIITGVLVGAILGKLPSLAKVLNPFIIALQVAPKTPFVPLLIVWFGFGLTSKIIIAALLAFFPIFTNTYIGVRSTPPGFHDLGTILRLGSTRRFFRIELPNALPTILTGLEVGVVLAVTGAIVGEFLGGSSGLGFQTIASMNSFNTPRLFGVILLLTLMGYLLHLIVSSLRRWLVPWHESAKKLSTTSS